MWTKSRKEPIFPQFSGIFSDWNLQTSAVYQNLEIPTIFKSSADLSAAGKERGVVDKRSHPVCNKFAFRRVAEREMTRSNLLLRGPSSFGNAKVTVLMEAALSTNSVDVCADGVILGDDSHMITFIEEGFFV